MARAGDFWNRNAHRVDWRAGLLPVAAARRATCQSGLASVRELFVYACKIKETTNGCRRCARGQTRQAVQVVAQRRFTRNVQIDEQSGAAQNGQDQAQRETDKEKAALRLPMLCEAAEWLLLLHYGHGLSQRVQAHLARPGKRMIKDIDQK